MIGGPKTHQIGREKMMGPNTGQMVDKNDLGPMTSQIGRETVMDCLTKSNGGPKASQQNGKQKTMRGFQRQSNWTGKSDGGPKTDQTVQEKALRQANK